MEIQAPQLEAFLYRQIPLAKALGARVVRVDEKGAEVSAPLEPNRNHLGTVFGGSLHSILVLSAYVWLFHVLEKHDYSGHVILKSDKTQYLLPVQGEIKAVCSAPEREAVKRFFETFERKGKARILIPASVLVIEGEACVFEGEFVAVKR
jgi:thioesterase domain-containing protein